jgi:hypothetical protein
MGLNEIKLKKMAVWRKGVGRLTVLPLKVGYMEREAIYPLSFPLLLMFVVVSLESDVVTQGFEGCECCVLYGLGAQELWAGARDKPFTFKRHLFLFLFLTLF